MMGGCLFVAVIVLFCFGILTIFFHNTVNINVFFLCFQSFKFFIILQSNCVITSTLLGHLLQFYGVTGVYWLFFIAGLDREVDLCLFGRPDFWIGKFMI